MKQAGKQAGNTKQIVANSDKRVHRKTRYNTTPPQHLQNREVPASRLQIRRRRCRACKSHAGRAATRAQLHNSAAATRCNGCTLQRAACRSLIAHSTP